jgi:hypothetical protein
MYQQLWGYKVEDKLYLGVREQKRLNTTVVEHQLRNQAVSLRLQGLKVPRCSLGTWRWVTIKRLR